MSICVGYNVVMATNGSVLVVFLVCVTKLPGTSTESWQDTHTQVQRIGQLGHPHTGTEDRTVDVDPYVLNF